MRWPFFAMCAIFTIFVWRGGGNWLALQLEFVETRYLDPVTTGEFEGYSPDHLTAIYEAELRRHVDEYEFRIIQDSVASMVRLFQCDSSAIYEAALPECSLDPFVIRKDGVAAGFIQFTNAGCSNMPFKLPDVKRWCYTRNAPAMMQATRIYLTAAKGNRPMKSGLDVYLAVFCPAKLGSGPDAVLYDSGLAYLMNANLDGWTNNNGRIYRSPSNVDGKITVGELGYWMTYHKIKLIKKHLKYQNNDKVI